MGIRFEKTTVVLSKGEIRNVLSRLREAQDLGYLETRTENNSYLLASFKGVESMGISPKWNVKIYTFNEKKRGHSVVCVDMKVLWKLAQKEYDYFIPPDLETLRIDDAGWGFPLCGVMVGVTDESTVETAVVPVEYFRHDTDVGFETGLYLEKYAQLGLELVEGFGASPKTHRIEICSGYVNQPLRSLLRKRKYDVRVVEIKGLLQRHLEDAFRRHVEEQVGEDIYYDPKEMPETSIPKSYRACLEFGRRHCPEKIKTGWKALSSER